MQVWVAVSVRPAASRTGEKRGLTARLAEEVDAGRKALNLAFDNADCGRINLLVLLDDECVAEGASRRKKEKTGRTETRC